MRKAVQVKIEPKLWNKLKSKALDSDNTVEDETNIMLEQYVK